MDPPHDYMASQLGGKLKARRVVGWYDERGEFAPFVNVHDRRSLRVVVLGCVRIHQAAWRRRAGPSPVSWASRGIRLHQVRPDAPVTA